MPKRFEDTDKYKKSFIRELPGAYKLFWDYLCLNCDHAGIWQVDFEIAQIYLGNDMAITKDLAIGYFNAGEVRIVELADGKKWFIKPFINFQYGNLNPLNRVHASVLLSLSKYSIKGLISPLQGAKDKDKDKDKEIGRLHKDKKNINYNAEFLQFWTLYPYKTKKDKAWEAWQKKTPPLDRCLKTLTWQIQSESWLKEDGKYIPMPTTWINGGQWKDIQPGYEEFVCECGNVGQLKKGFTGKLTCGKCNKIEVIQ